MTPLAEPWGSVVLAVELVLFAYFVVCNGVYAFTAVTAIIHLPRAVKLRHADPVRTSYSELDLPVSIIVAAYNDEDLIFSTVRSLLAQDYSQFELIVVNDGSTDHTLEQLNEEFELDPYPGVYRDTLLTEDVVGIYRSMAHPSLIVVDKVHGGTGDALNAGINMSQYPLIFAGNVLCRYERTALRTLVEPLQKDVHVVGTGSASGVIGARVLGDGPEQPSRRVPSHFLERLQVVEYLRSLLVSRMHWAPFTAHPVAGRTSGLWRKQVVVDAGGYRVGTVWEELELTLRIHAMLQARDVPYRVAYTQNPICWTRVPESGVELFRQRRGWARALSESVTLHRRFVRTQKAAGTSSTSLPLLLNWLAPPAVLVAVAFSIWGMVGNFLSVQSQLVLLALVVLLALQQSLVALLNDQLAYDIYGEGVTWSLFSAAVAETFGFRQLVWFAGLVGMSSWVFRRPARPRTS